MKKIIIAFIGAIILPISLVKAQGTDFFKWPLIVDALGTSAKISGKLDSDPSSGVPNFIPYIYFETATNTAQFAATPTPNNPLQPFYEATVAPTGDYLVTISNLTPNTQYFFRQIIKKTKNETSFLSVKTGEFNSTTGVALSGTQPNTENKEARTYRLLAPWPGLSVLMDPSLCAEKSAQGTLPPGSICSINDLLNYLFKLLIGLAAVGLVLRLMVSGYQMITTESSLTKAIEKTKFTSSLFGLLLALSAYLILNTINPKLVSNTIALDKIDFAASFERYGIDAAPPIGASTGGQKVDLSKMNFPSGVFCPGKIGGTGDIKTVAQSFQGKVTYSNATTGTKARGNPGPNGTIYLDCSLYVNTVLSCAGVTPKTGPWTLTMKAKGDPISGLVEVKNGEGYINGTKLTIGDLVGTRVGDHGHVWIYIGDGEIIDSQVNDGRAGASVGKPEKLSSRPYGKNLPALNFVLRR